MFHAANAYLPKGRPTLFKAWSVVDADLSFMLHWLILNGDAVPDRLREYAERHWARTSVKEFVRRERPAYRPY